ncbi:MAG: HAMP domain-containing protein [Holosporales bacterium]|nr:HAMP domain-containing protein [Holosporales bacterium]
MNSKFIVLHFPFVLGCVAVISALATYSVISYGGVSLAQRTSIVTPFVIFDAIIITLLTIVIAQKIIWIFKEHKRGAIGAHLHMTIISLFSLVTMAPSIVVALLAVTFFKSGVSIWFSQPVKDTLNDANVVAELYLQEHMRSIRVDAVFIADRVKHLAFEYDLFTERDKRAFQKDLDSLVDQQNLDEALVLVVNKASRGMAYVGSSLSFSLELAVANMTDSDDLDIASDGDVVVKENQGVMQALTHVESDLQDLIMYLWVGKEIDKNILKYVTRARDSTKYYNELLANHQQFQLVLITLFALSSLLLLLVSIWVGLFLANVLVDPISKLISAADSVSNGDLSVRISGVSVKNELKNLVQSFNRMTERLERQNKDLIISEKKSAWSDIARKIAHEVKNPLTPIQLSAERLKRRYSKEIKSDPVTFEKCIDTIVRQVSHIENLINEFSAFARMPEAVFATVDLTQLIRDSVFLQKQAFPDILYQLEFPQKTILWNCDGQQMLQVLTNILQNAANAISEGAEHKNGKITIFIYQFEGYINIVIEDNGPGFPKENRERLFEPYYTTRKSGTGLGMAIVLRIITEHFGTMELKDAVEHSGARVEIMLPRIDNADFKSEQGDGSEHVC